MRNNSYISAIISGSLFFVGQVIGSGIQDSQVECDKIPRENLETILKNGTRDECLPQYVHNTEIRDNGDYVNALYINPMLSLGEAKDKKLIPDFFPVVIIYTGEVKRPPMTWSGFVVDMNNNPDNYSCFITEEGKKRCSNGVEARRFQAIVPDKIKPEIFPEPYNLVGVALSDNDMIKALPVTLKQFPE